MDPTSYEPGPSKNEAVAGSSTGNDNMSESVGSQPGFNLTTVCLPLFSSIFSFLPVSLPPSISCAPILHLVDRATEPIQLLISARPRQTARYWHDHGPSLRCSAR